MRRASRVVGQYARERRSLDSRSLASALRHRREPRLQQHSIQGRIRDPDRQQVHRQMGDRLHLRTGLDPDGSAVAGEWNRINFESRHDAIRVYVNGVVDSGHPNNSDAVLDSSDSPYYDDAPHSSRVQPRFRIRPPVGLLQGFTCARCFRHQNRKSARPQ